MGVCFSKKKASSTHHDSPPPPPPQAAALPVSSSVAPTSVVETGLSCNTLKAGSGPKVAAEEAQVGNASQGADSFVKKEIFVIKHRKSHDRQRPSSPPPQPLGVPHSAENDSASSASTEGGICNISTAVRTSSCTKEEVDAILIQCGRLSRSNSAGKTPSSSRKYSGSKRSYDFDNENDIGAASNDCGLRKKGNDGIFDDDRPRRRQSSRSSSSQGQERRRTPSREREQRSGSRERCSSGGGRRVSRSPGRRSENTQAQVSNAANNTTSRPGKLVSVPATVSSMAMDKSGIGVEAATTANAVKRITVKRNVGVGEAAGGVISSRTAASPRSQSPARTNPNPNANGNGNNAKGGCNENQQQPVLSRSSSRKAEHSPYRRNPLSEIDPNSLAYPQSAATANKNSHKVQGGIKESTNVINQKSNVQGANHKAGSIAMAEEVKTQSTKAGAENLKPQAQAQAQPLTRSRSSRQSRDLDLNPETCLNPIPLSYTTLLLEDIQNFHQTNSNNNPPSFSLPPSVSKACSILEAVADLNSTTSSNLSSAFSENRKGLSAGDINNNGYNNNIGVGRKRGETRDPFVESEVVGSDDLMEPSFHKYVTVRRGGSDMEEQESSGSNSFVGSGQQQQHWGLSSSSWEPNSVDSTDRYTSRTRSREDDYSGPMALQRDALGLAESGSDMKNSARKGLSGRRDADHQYAGGKIGAGKGLHSIPFAATAST